MTDTQALALWVFLMTAVGALVIGLLASAVIVWWSRKQYPHG